jgi:polyisoprenoid-binding protein YceI
MVWWGRMLWWQPAVTFARGMAECAAALCRPTGPFRIMLAVPMLAALMTPSALADHGFPPGLVSLVPETGRVAIRTYGLGLLPLDGQFARFDGVLRYDPGNHALCTITLRVDVASLTMGSGVMTSTVLGPDFLNGVRYPTLAYAGACSSDGMSGQLTMHGVTRPFALTLDWTKDRVTAEGQLQRANWGMTARPLLGGRTVRITVTARLSERGG